MGFNVFPGDDASRGAGFSSAMVFHRSIAGLLRSFPCRHVAAGWEARAPPHNVLNRKNRLGTPGAVLLTSFTVPSPFTFGSDCQLGFAKSSAYSIK